MGIGGSAATDLPMSNHEPRSRARDNWRDLEADFIFIMAMSLTGQSGLSASRVPVGAGGCKASGNRAFEGWRRERRGGHGGGVGENPPGTGSRAGEFPQREGVSYFLAGGGSRAARTPSAFSARNRPLRPHHCAAARGAARRRYVVSAPDFSP